MSKNFGVMWCSALTFRLLQMLQIITAAIITVVQLWNYWVVAIVNILIMYVYRFLIEKKMGLNFQNTPTIF